MPHFAPGIPDRSRHGDLSKLPLGKLIDIVTQKHLAHRAGPHTDLRIGTPQLGLYSWAVRKGLPAPGQKHLAVQQPLHSHAYGKFEGVIPSGYGAGTVKKEESGQAVVTKLTPDEVHFTLASRRHQQRLALIRPKKNPNSKNWLLLNTTPTEAIPYEKTHYTLVPKEHAEQLLKNLKPGSSAQAKIDGAAALTRLGKGHIEVASYRTAKHTGWPIVYTEKMFEGKRPAPIDLPKHLTGSILRGEIYGQHGKTVIPPQELGGILNASLAKAMHKMPAKNVELKQMVFDILQRGKTKVPRSTPYSERMQMLKEVMPHLPSGKFHLPEEAKTPDDAVQLWKHISSGQHPLTYEGMVVHPPSGKPSKIKIREEHDVHLRGFFPGAGRLANKAVGGFTYSWSPKGKVVGRVGTGLSDELRRQMHQDPGGFLGRTARVIAQEKLPSGALRAPALLALHEG